MMVAAILSLPYFFILLYIFRNLLKAVPFENDSNPDIFISVVIACRNEEKALPNLLDCLAHQKYSQANFEVIIIDDHSSDTTAALASGFNRIQNLTIIPNKGSGKKEALRTGINTARGELIVTTDADCTTGKEWLKTIGAFYQSDKPDMIISPVMLEEKSGFFGRFQELEFLSLQAITAGTAEAGNPTMCNGANLAFTKTAYTENVNQLRFDIATGDDVFLLHSMKKRKSSIRLLFSENALVRTRQAENLSSFLKQRKRWASKATAYRDIFSIVLGIVTFATILIQILLLSGSFFDVALLQSFLIFFIMKSIPDFLILMQITKRYGRRNLMWSFLPSQFIYPFYVLIVSGFAFFSAPIIHPSSEGVRSA
jgi:cellulose synthase/poly-beta-1,6-N-acetylglucosamine synthase-like glycosyltransferase